MERGWVKLWRKYMFERVFADSDLWHVFTWCLMKANHTPKWVTIAGRGNRTVYVDRGQFVYGRNTCAEAIGVSPTTAWYRMKKLEEWGYIKIKSDNLCSIVTIDNIDDGIDEAISFDNHLETVYKPSDTTKNEKKEENEKKEDKNICEEIFESFWKEYPKRNGKRLNRAQAKKEFDKIKDVNSVLIAVSNYSCSTDVKRGIGIKDAFRWLRDGCWKDWMEPEDGGGAIASGNSVVCEQCGGRFKQRNKSNKFCSVKCYEAFRNG